MLNRPATDTQITHLRRLWLYVLCALVMIFLVAPTLLVIPMSFSDSRYLTFPPESWSLRWYEAYFSSIEWREATFVSFNAAFWTTILATFAGTLAAYGLHTARVKGSRYVQVALALPMMIPVILMPPLRELALKPMRWASTTTACTPWRASSRAQDNPV